MHDGRGMMNNGYGMTKDASRAPDIFFFPYSTDIYLLVITTILMTTTVSHVGDLGITTATQAHDNDNSSIFSFLLIYHVKLTTTTFTTNYFFLLLYHAYSCTSVLIYLVFLMELSNPIVLSKMGFINLFGNIGILNGMVRLNSSSTLPTVRYRCLLCSVATMVQAATGQYLIATGCYRPLPDR
jgi:hypothetical protein